VKDRRVRIVALDAEMLLVPRVELLGIARLEKYTTQTNHTSHELSSLDA